MEPHGVSTFLLSLLISPVLKDMWPTSRSHQACVFPVMGNGKTVAALGGAPTRGPPAGGRSADKHLSKASAESLARRSSSCTSCLARISASSADCSSSRADMSSFWLRRTFQRGSCGWRVKGQTHFQAICLLSKANAQNN